MHNVHIDHISSFFSHLQFSLFPVLLFYDVEPNLVKLLYTYTIFAVVAICLLGVFLVWVGRYIIKPEYPESTGVRLVTESQPSTNCLKIQIGG